MREVRPQVIVGYNDFGGYGHPDHIRSALIAKAAFERSAADSDAPLKLYETASSNRRRDEVMKRAAERGVKSWWEPGENETDERAARARGAHGQDGSRAGSGHDASLTWPTSSTPSTPPWAST